MLPTGIFAPIVFHPATFFTTMALFAALFGMVVWSIARNYPDTITGVREWAIGIFLFSLSLLHLGIFIKPLDRLISMQWSHLLVNVVGNVAAALVMNSAFKLSNRRPPLRLMLGILLFHAVTGAMAVLYWDEWRKYNRVVASFGIGICYGLAAWATFVKPWRENGMARWFVGSSLYFVAAVLFLRGVTVFFSSGGGSDAMSLTSRSPIMSTVYVGIAIAAVAMTIGAVLLANDRLKHQLLFLALRDGLTGLYSRRAFFDLAAQRSPKKISVPKTKAMKRAGDFALGSMPDARGVLMIDIDHFKKINDQFGHQAGDRAIAEAARLITMCVRTTDIAARYGGEEFVVLVERADPFTLQSVAERLIESARARHSSSAPFDPNSETSIPIFTLSIGGVMVQEAENLHTAIGRADASLYRAKRGGRDRYVFDDSLTPAA